MKKNINKVDIIIVAAMIIIIVIPAVLIFSYPENNCEHEWHLFYATDQYVNQVCSKCGDLYYDKKTLPDDSGCAHLNYEYIHVGGDYTSFYCPECYKYWEVVIDKTGEEILKTELKSGLTLDQFADKAKEIMYNWGAMHHMKLPQTEETIFSEGAMYFVSNESFRVQKRMYTTEETDLKFQFENSTSVSITYYIGTGEVTITDGRSKK